MKTIILFLLVLFYSIVAFCHSSNALNLAYLKSYRVSPAPNYPLSAPSTDKTSLTDGKFTTGFFWTRKTTVGWSYVKNAEILIDLGKISDIGGLTFNTARGQGSEVYFPAHVYAFIGADLNNLFYAGDIVKSPDNTPGLYKVEKFELSGLKANGRYVLLEAVPKGKYLFCDEIEVLAPNGNAKTMQLAVSSVATGTADVLDIDAARNLAKRLESVDIEKEFLSGLLGEVTSLPAGQIDDAQITGIKQSIEALTSLSESESIETNILKLRGEALRARFPGKKLLLEAFNPWAPLAPGFTPSGNPAGNLTFILPQGGYDNAALVLTNLATEPKKVTLDYTSGAEGAPELSLFYVPFVKSAAMEYVADPLMPVKEGFTLRPGESRMLFFSAHGKSPGKWNGNLKISCGDINTSLTVISQVLNISIPEKQSLNVTNWGYLDFKPIRDCKPEAVKDMVEHHTNVVVVPTWYIPFSDTATAFDFLKLDNYLKLQDGASKVMFFLNFNSGTLLTANNKYKFMSAGWKVWFKKLYTGIVYSANRSGFSEDQVYVYPFDEMCGEDVDRFIDLASWARREIPTIKFYATFE